MPCEREKHLPAIAEARAGATATVLTRLGEVSARAGAGPMRRLGPTGNRAGSLAYDTTVAERCDHAPQRCASSIDKRRKVAMRQRAALEKLGVLVE